MPDLLYALRDALASDYPDHDPYEMTAALDAAAGELERL